MSIPRVRSFLFVISPLLWIDFAEAMCYALPIKEEVGMQKLREKLQGKNIGKGILALIGAAILIVIAYFISYGVTLFFTL